MQLPQDAPKFLQSSALVIVAAKEDGIIYRIQDGEIQQVDFLEHRLLPLSDDEGYFFGGVGGSGGAPKERNDEAEYIKTLRKKIAHELNQLIKHEPVNVLYIFEPEHLKGRIEAELQEHPHVALHHVRYGNYVSESPRQLIDYISEYINEHKIDLDDHDYDKDFKKF